MGIACEDKINYLELNIKGKITKGPILSGKKLWLKSTWGLDGKSQFYYSVNGKKYMPFGKFYQMEWGSYRGDRIAIYNYNNLADEGYIDVDYFHYTYSK